MADRSPLPPPDAAAQALSRRLSDRIGAVVDAAGGWIGFDRYMAEALYAPGLGYYANGRPVFGARGDFVTAPELTPLFADTLAEQLAGWLADPIAGPWLREADGTPAILEFGAGSGLLAAQLLNALHRLGFAEVRYRIVELSADLRQLQRHTLATRQPVLAERVEWLDALPVAFRGIVIGNEVLDAMPVRCFEWDGERLHEAGVVRAGAGFDWGLVPADAALAAAVDSLARFGVDRTTWQAPYRSEVCPAQGAWLATVADAMESGAILLLDYGFPAAEYYHPQRAGGTLMTHYRHRAGPDPFQWPGLADITAHVDFSRLAAAGVAARLAPVGYLSQARFLLNAGLLDVLEALPRDEQRVWFAQASAVQRLLSEAEMGELFKVIAFAKAGGDAVADGDDHALPPAAALELAAALAAPGFVDGDRLPALDPR